MTTSSRELPAKGFSGRLDLAGPTGQVRGAALPATRWLLVFLSFEFACQVALLFPELASLRVAFRSAPFVASLALFLLPGKSSRYHPARPAAVAIIAILAASLLHPLMNSVGAGAATILLNLAIFGPIFWVPRLRLDREAIYQLILLFWAFQTASAALGALQVYFPGRFQPATSVMLTDSMLSGLKITLADGSRVFRPMGLTDSPGGAGVGGMYSVLFGMALWLERPRLLFRIVLLVSMGIGLFALYICQIRSLLVMLIPAFCASMWPQLSRLRFGRAAATIAPLVVTALVAFAFAVAVGGDSMTKRLYTLIDSDPRSVYYTNRGFFLEQTFTEMLPEYPLGAGMGRWGMMRSYFGDPYNAASPQIWVEIQWTAWLLDGGLALMLAWAAAMLIAMRESLRAALSRVPTLRKLSGLSGILLGYNIGVIAITFNSCPFASTGGVDFWLLNAAFFAAVCQAEHLADEREELGNRTARRSVIPSWQ